jgi:hypothetical protein
MCQVVVCRHLRTIGSASGLEFWKSQRRQCRSRLWYFGSRSHGEAAMHQHLSCALSRLSSSESDTIVRMSGCLPGLYPIHLHRFRTGMTDVNFVAVSGNAAPNLSLQVLLMTASRSDRMMLRCTSPDVGTWRTSSRRSAISDVAVERTLRR